MSASETLGHHRSGKSCLYLDRPDHVEMGVLRQLAEESVGFIKNRDRILASKDS